MANDHVAQALDAIGQRDFPATSEYRIFGPPGTGKTTSLAHQIRRAVERFGPERVLVTSFSRAAAAELAGRSLGIKPDRLGTLHAHCFNALGKPKIAEAHVCEWNATHKEMALTPLKKQERLDGEDAPEEPIRCGGDHLLQSLNLYRALLARVECWPADVRGLSKEWEAYKKSRRLLDFSDLIEICLRDVTAAPGNPAAIFVDEAQDLNPMQLALIRKWGRRAQYFVIAADDDQTLYSFAGASPEALGLPPIPPDQQIILEQSYRVPRRVHALADRLIHRVSSRLEKRYLARPQDGAVFRHSAGYKCPDYAILSSAMRHVEEGKKVMFLASCAYMLGPLLTVLRKNSIPFHNPYRKANGLWNPLRLTKSSTASRVAALLEGEAQSGDGRWWTREELELWTECVRPGIVRQDARDRLQYMDPKCEVSIECLREVFEAPALESLVAARSEGDRSLISWLRNRVSPEFHARIQYAADIAATQGHRALTCAPRVVVGTIHSVKGGEADVVYLFPDLSAAGESQYRVCGARQDSVIRVFYVGATRATETLYVCGSSGASAIAL